MWFSGSFGKTIDILKREMDVSLLRRRIIANNVANAETPNFKRTVVNFESELKRALDSEKVRKLPVSMTHRRHIPNIRPVDYRTVRPRMVLDYLTASKNNGNNVDIEEETMLALENQLLYQTMVRVLNNQYSQISMVLR